MGFHGKTRLTDVPNGWQPALGSIWRDNLTLQQQNWILSMKNTNQHVKDFFDNADLG